MIVNGRNREALERSMGADTIWAGFPKSENKEIIIQLKIYFDFKISQD